MIRRSSILFCLLAVFGLAPTGAVGQDKAPTITVEDLRTPYSPAFVLLGVEPSTIERPTNPKALALSAFGAVQSGGNFAMEVAPYWLKSHPDLTFSKYYEASVPDTILQTLSFSAGSATDVDDSSDGESGDATGAAAALRFALWRGHPRPSDVERLREVGRQLDDLYNELLDARERGEAAVVAEIEEKIDVIVTESDSVRERIGRSGHLGFSCDVAGGAGGKFPTGDSDDGRLTAAGLWITPAYRFEGDLMNLEVIGVARYLHQNEANDPDFIDVGARVTGEFSDAILGGDLAVSFEGVRRIDTSGDQDTERFAGIIEYELPESVQLGNAKYLTATFGQDFDDQSGDSRTIALLGLNFTFGVNPTVRVD